MVTLALSVLATAAVYSIAFPPFGVEMVLWVALVPLLRVVERSGPLRAACAGAGFGIGIAVFIVSWIGPSLVGYYERSLPLTAALLVALWLTMGAPFYAVACAALAFVRPRLPRLVWLLLVPAAWVTAEWSRGSLGLRASWALVGDAFHEWPRLRQVADATAVYGVSFVVVLANAAVLEAVHVARRETGSAILLRAAAVLAAVLVAVLAYGEWRRDQWARAPENGPALDVLLVQGNVERELRWQRTTAGAVLLRYGLLTREAALVGGRPDLVIWPENAIQTAVDDPAHGAALRGLVRVVDAPLLLGAPRSERTPRGTRHWNSAFLLRPEVPPEHYDKRRLMPFGESDPLGSLFDTGRRGDLDEGRWIPGSRPGVLWAGDHPDRALGVLICLEALYPGLARDAVASGARVLVNLSNDGWFRGHGGPEQHFQQTVFRAVEQRRPLVRVTTTGVSAVVRPDGTVSHRLEHGERGTLRVAVRPEAEPSPYARVGDLFAHACIGALVAALGVAAFRRSGTPGGRGMS